jgi:RNA polymerase sigma factor (TIGR02999 family)
MRDTPRVGRVRGAIRTKAQTAGEIHHGRRADCLLQRSAAGRRLLPLAWDRPALDSSGATGFDPTVASAPADLTHLLRAWRQGDRAAFDQIAPLIYDELRRLAAFHLRGERKDHTFGPTDLISEAYLRLAGGAQLEFHDRAHFFAIASRNMRQILVDHARKRGADKRGAGERPAQFDETRVAIDRPSELVALDEALGELGKFDARKARITELHYFGGLTQDEIAAVCDVHVNTVARDLRLSEAWLRSRLRPGDSES